MNKAIAINVLLISDMEKIASVDIRKRNSLYKIIMSTSILTWFIRTGNSYRLTDYVLIPMLADLFEQIYQFQIYLTLIDQYNHMYF